MSNQNLIANLVPTPTDNRSIMEQLATLSEEDRINILEDIIAKKYPKYGYEGIKFDWSLHRRGNQWYPDHDKWKICSFLAGRWLRKTGAINKCYFNGSWLENYWSVRCRR